MSMLQTAISNNKTFLKQFIICQWFSNLETLSKHEIYLKG